MSKNKPVKPQCSKCKGFTHKEGRCIKCGVFMKGYSGKNVPTRKQKVEKGFKEAIEGHTNMQDMITAVAKYLVESCEDRVDAMRVFKEVAPYFLAKKSSVKTEITKTEKYEFVLSDGTVLGEAILTKDEPKVIEGKVMEEFDKVVKDKEETKND